MGDSFEWSTRNDLTHEMTKIKMVGTKEPLKSSQSLVIFVTNLVRAMALAKSE